MERKRITCPESAHLEEIDVERTSFGILIGGCSRFSPRCAVECETECARRMDRRDHHERDVFTERVLLANGGSEARTSEIVRALAAELVGDGLVVEVADLEDGGAPPPEDHDLVVIVSPVRLGRVSRAARVYAERHGAALSAVPAFWIRVSRPASDGLDDPARIHELALAIADEVPRTAP